MGAGAGEKRAAFAPPLAGQHPRPRALLRPHILRRLAPDATAAAANANAMARAAVMTLLASMSVTAVTAKKFTGRPAAPFPAPTSTATPPPRSSVEADTLPQRAERNGAASFASSLQAPT